MSNDLTDLLRAHERVVEAGTEGMVAAAHGRTRVLTRVRRVRRTRAALEVGGGLAVAAAVATGAVLLTRPDPVPPVGPTPSETTPAPSPTPSATPSPTPTETAPPLPDPGFAGTVTVDPHLPSAEPITPEVWAQAGSGWVLASYQEGGFGPDGDTIAPAGPQVAYLVSPDGVRHELVALGDDATVQVVAWRPGETAALVSLTLPNGKSGGWARLDLVTGARTPVAVPDGAWATGDIYPDGRAHLLVPTGDGWADQAIDADGVVGPPPVVEAPGALAAAQAAYADHQCAIAGRFDPRTVVVSCKRGEQDVLENAWSGTVTAGDLDALLLTVRDDGTGPLTTLVRIDGSNLGVPWWGSVTVVGGQVVVEGTSGWASDTVPGRWLLRDGQWSDLPGVQMLQAEDEQRFAATAGASGTSLYTGVTAGLHEAAPTALVRDDLAAGTATVLVPFPAANPDGAGHLWRSLNGWYVVP